MALIVETGAGVPNADAVADMEFYNSYMADHGYQLWEMRDEGLHLEPAVRRGTRALEMLFADRWPGQKTYGRDQSRAWPRTNVVTTEGTELDPTEIPIEFKIATAEAAWIELNDEGAMLPASAEQRERSVRVGPISIDYWWNSNNSSPSSQLEVFIPYFEKLLWNLLLESSSTTGTQWLLRA